MKKSFLYAIVSLFCVVLVVYSAAQTIRIQAKLSELARPARLFNPKLIESQLPPNPDWNVKLSENHDRFFYVVCQQTLCWLGRGMQALVFETQDGKYVVKFFQMARFREPESRGFFKDIFSKEPKERQLQRLAHREEIFSSSKLCFEKLQEETGIVYVHLNRTRDKIHGIKLVDKYGQSHRICGDDASFVVQKKALYLIPTLTKLMEAGQVEQAKERLAQVCNLLLSLAEKGFADGDDALIRNNNIGLAEDRAIYIDTGHLFRAENLDVAKRMRYEFQVRLDPLEKWLNVTFPVLGNHFRKLRTEMLARFEPQKTLEA